MIENRNLNLLMKPVDLRFRTRKIGGLEKFQDLILIFDKIDDEKERASWMVVTNESIAAISEDSKFDQLW